MRLRLRLGWWHRRRDRKVVAWLRTPEGRAYLALGSGSGSSEEGELGVSVIDVVRQEIDRLEPEP